VNCNTPACAALRPPSQLMPDHQKDIMPNGHIHKRWQKSVVTGSNVTSDITPDGHFHKHWQKYVVTGSNVALDIMPNGHFHKHWQKFVVTG
jgi:hypothetical protein